ncbi:L-methionine (R)-S-oxide reductase [Pedobacter sp. UYEF25]
MSEDLTILLSDNKENNYRSIIPQIASLLEGEDDFIANMANISAALKEQFSFFWVGFYLVKNDELVLGPFQGPVACTRIKRGNGVCGTSWLKEEVIIVDDVDAFPGHIACSSGSKSEIVLPLKKDGVIVGVLDVDSEHLSHFDSIDQINLEIIIKILLKYS